MYRRDKFDIIFLLNTKFHYIVIGVFGSEGEKFEIPKREDKNVQ